MGAKVKGISQVVRNLNKLIDDTQGKKAVRATYMALSVVEVDSAAKIPIDTSTLINSGFKDIDTSTGNVVGRLGYTAEYAEAVHNASGKLKGKPRTDFGLTSNRSSVGPQKPKAFGGGTGKGNYWDPHGEPKFLVKALEKNKDTIKDIYKKELKP